MIYNLLGNDSVYTILEFCWQLLLAILQWTNDSSVISKWNTISTFSSI